MKSTKFETKSSAFDDENERLLAFIFAFIVGYAKSRGWSKKDLKDFIDGSFETAPDLPAKAPNIGDILGIDED